MVPKSKIDKILDGYDPEEITIATLCSHSSLQIFHGARKLGFKTLGLTITHSTKYYDAFPLGKPDEIIKYKDFADMESRVDELYEKNAIIIPHGSFVEYMGSERFAEYPVPSYGNREVLNWESSREKQREWIEGAGVSMPEIINDPKSIDRPVMVKYNGAKGGKGYFIAMDYNGFKMAVDPDESYNIQEYCMGTRYYMHFFYDPLKKDGYRCAEGGSLELMSMDRRDESNIDELYKLGNIDDLKKVGMYPSFVVTGNTPVVLRESLLPKAFDMAERVVDKSYELFGGMWGPFCLETVVNDKLQFKAFEISTRIVAGTNPFISGSPYADLIYPGMSTGARMAMHIKEAAKEGKLKEIVS